MSNIEIGDGKWSITPPTGKSLVLNGVEIKKITATVGYAEFTDGGAAVGTYNLPAIIPVGALYLGTAITAITGFTNDTSAVITIGDGTDVDRYNTGTPSVFTTAAYGIAAGAPSGVLYHATQVTPKLTVTTAADFTSVNAGSVTIEMYYLT
ncbi:hypothetical protein CCP3SC15_1310008 [Gammaproteobacteria bacterium]